MATFTSFLNLRKPSTSDTVNVTLDLSDNMDILDGKLGPITEDGWVAWNPVLSTAGSATVLGNATTTGSFYKEIGKTVLFVARFELGSTTSLGSGGMRLSLPTPVREAAPVPPVFFEATYYDNPPGIVKGFGLYNSTSDVVDLLCPSTSAGGYDRAVTGAVPFAWTSGDQISMRGFYERT